MPTTAKNSSVKVAISSIVAAEQALENRVKKLEKDYPEVLTEIKQIDKAREEIQMLKTSLKKSLEEKQDYDVYEESGVRVSVTKVAKVAVEDIDQVPEDYKETKVVADEKKALEYLRVFGDVPSGFVEKSYSRLNWREMSK